MCLDLVFILKSSQAKKLFPVNWAVNEWFKKFKIIGLNMLNNYVLWTMSIDFKASHYYECYIIFMLDHYWHYVMHSYKRQERSFWPYAYCSNHKVLLSCFQFILCIDHHLKGRHCEFGYIEGSLKELLKLNSVQVHQAHSKCI